ncbi:MAG: hypothetical protein GX640_17260 [Fibrobacter sp.]|nr:hypothetical protein [Fibrobacter sp.]
MNLNFLAEVAENHWKTFLPQLYRKLQEEGALEKELLAASKRASEKISTLIEQGLRPQEAREIVLQEEILLSPEPQS